MSKSVVSQALFSITLCACTLFMNIAIILICDLCTMKFLPESGIKEDTKKLKEVKISRDFRSWLLV